MKKRIAQIVMEPKIVRSATEVHKAHDMIEGALRKMKALPAGDPRKPDPETELIISVTRSTLCWILGHPGGHTTMEIIKDMSEILTQDVDDAEEGQDLPAVLPLH